MTKLQGILDKAAAAGNKAIVVGTWAMIFQMILKFLEECSENNSPEAIEGFVRADDTRQIEIDGGRVLRKLLREEYGRWGGRIKWRQAKGSIKITLDVARETDAGTVAEIVRNPMA